MAYRFESDETFEAGLRRVATEQLDKAIGRLTDEVENDPVEAVHGARKAIKKERSLLRLVEPGLGRARRRRENSALRDIAHELGRAREADALISTLDELASRFAGQVPEATTELLREAFKSERDAAREALLKRGTPGEAAEALGEIRARAEHLKLRRTGWRTVGKGLERSYRRGRRAARRAADTPGPRSMHEWRKRAKDHWYHLRLLECSAPGVVGGAAKDVHELADLLGDLHDLAELDTAVRERAGKLPADLDPVLALIEHREAQLNQQAFSVGARVYAESPKAFGKRMKRYWKAWEAGGTAAEDAENPRLLADATRHPIPV